MIKNAKLSGYYFYRNLNIWGDFQIRISVPLRLKNWATKKAYFTKLKNYKAMYYWGLAFYNRVF